MQRVIISVLFCLALVFKANATEQEITVLVDHIRETRWNDDADRSNRLSSCFIQLKFEGKITQESIGIVEVRPIKATNDLGEDLIQV